MATHFNDARISMSPKVIIKIVFSTMLQVHYHGNKCVVATEKMQISYQNNDNYCGNISSYNIEPDYETLFQFFSTSM